MIRDMTFFSISDFLQFWLSNPDLLTSNNKRTFLKYYHSYNKYFGDYIRNQYQDQTFEVINLIKKLRNPRILEIGSGCGTESLYFSILGADVTGIDIQKDRLVVAKERLKILLERGFDIRVKFLLKNLFDFYDKEKYDIIWMEQAFHHIEPRKLVYEKIRDLLKPGGYCIMSESNAWHPLIQVGLIKKRGFKTIKTYIDDNGRESIYGNERITFPFLLTQGFRKVGIYNINCRYFRLFPNHPIIDNLCLYRLEKIISSKIKFLFSHYNWVGKMEE